MVLLKLHHPHWIKDEGDDPTDQCAHGSIELTINNVEFVSEADGDWTVSAAALFLLRTATSDHGPDNSVAEGNFLVPCCGFNIWPSDETKYPYYILGCNTGIDPTVRHTDRRVCISLGEKTAVIPRVEWAEAVFRFSQEVAAFYNASAKKVELDGFEREGWLFFWEDWGLQQVKVKELIHAA
jgi:hypothetical protein